jgi:signal transduction histidine kinase
MFERLFSKNKISTSGNEVLLDSEQLKKANEELYKKGAELAARNKTLSLLDGMYQVATKSLDINQASGELAQEVSKTLGMPYVSVIIYHPNDKSFELVGYAEKGSTSDNFEKNLRITDPEYPAFQALKDGRVLAVEPNGSMTGVFFPQQDRKRHLVSLGVVGTFVYPLITDRRPIGILIIGLNRAIEKLSAFEREGIASAVNVVSVALDKALAFSDLQAANDKLLELDELKTEFISIASHQLRTPLSIIKGYVSLMQEGAYGKMPKKSEQILQNIDESNERLVKLVDDFLDVSRLEQGRTQYSFAPVDMVALVDSIVTELRNKAEKKHMEIELHVGTKMPKSIIADEERLRHSIFNYVDNAVKYSPEKTTIMIELSVTDERMHCAVKDQGVGMDEDDIRNLFQKFYRSPKVLREFQGTGLGLYVVKEFIEAHGGQVYAKSDGIGAGSTFGFWIPFEPTSEIYQQWRIEREQQREKK